jgi:hypothetical protein
MNMVAPKESMETATLYELAVKEIGGALTMVSITDADEAALDRLAGAPTTEQRSFFKITVASQVEITPGIWALYLRLFVENWSEKTHDSAVILPELRQLYPSSGDRAANELLDRAAEAFESLGWAGYKPEQEAGLPESLMDRFFRVAVAVERLGDVDTAYNLAALALDLGPDQGGTREEVVRYALTLAVAADRMPQVAICGAHLAAVVAAAADTDTERRLEAFDCCEIALERLALAPEGIRGMAAKLLADVVRRREYLQKLLVPLFPLLPWDQRPEGLSEALGPEGWPERVSTQPRDLRTLG